MATLKQIYAMSQAEREACNQAAFDLIDASGVVWPGAAYHDYSMKHWPKGVGPKPTQAMLSFNGLIDRVRRNGRECLALAMGLRPSSAGHPGGVTHCAGGEYRSVPFADGMYPGGAAHNNIAQYTDQTRGSVKGMGWLARVVSSENRSDRIHYVITDAGMKQLAKTLATYGTAAAVPAKAKPVKAAGKANGKRKQPKATPVAPAETPTSDAPAVTEGTTSLPATVEAIVALAEHFNR